MAASLCAKEDVGGGVEAVGMMREGVRLTITDVLVPRFHVDFQDDVDELQDLMVDCRRDLDRVHVNKGVVLVAAALVRAARRAALVYLAGL